MPPFTCGWRIHRPEPKRQTGLDRAAAGAAGGAGAFVCGHDIESTGVLGLEIGAGFARDTPVLLTISRPPVVSASLPFVLAFDGTN